MALVASVLVLGGAFAAGNRGRIHDAVILKTLGRDAGDADRAFSSNILLLGAATAIFALVAGALAAWFVVSHDHGRCPSPSCRGRRSTTLGVSLVLTVGFGLAGTWRVLGQKAAPVLRNL